MNELLVRKCRFRLRVVALCALLLAAPARGQNYDLPPVLLIPDYGGAVTTGNEPLEATVRLGNQSDAIAGLCAESAYGTGDCAFKSSDSKILCRR